MSKHYLSRRTVTGCLTIAVIGLPASAQARIVQHPSVANARAHTQLPNTPYSNRALRPYGSPSGPLLRFPNTPYSNRALLSHGSASDARGQHGSRPGFPWSDAGIGAAGAAVLLGGAAAASGMTRRRRIARTVG
jgi:hypothetical protein